MSKRLQDINYPFCIFSGILIALAVKTFLIDIYRVNGYSMEKTLCNNQLVLVNKAAYGIQNPFTGALFVQWKKPSEGDIIIYFYNKNTVVKRCTATGGTELEYIEYVDFSSKSEYSLIVGKNKKIPLDSIQYHRMKTNSKVPENYILAVGDNYSLSVDSRNYGFVPEKNILGKVICR